LVASGADPFMPGWDGNDLPGVYALKTIPDAESIMEYMKQGVQDVTIVGGGYIGLEMAEGFSIAGMQVSLLNRSAYVGEILDEDMAEHIHEETDKQRIDLNLKEDVKEINRTDQLVKQQTDKRDYVT